MACRQATHLSICLPRTQTTYFHKGLMTSLFVSQPITMRNGGQLLPVLSQMEEEMQRTVEQQAVGQPGKSDARVTPPFPGTNLQESRHPSTPSPPVRQAFPLWDIRRIIYSKITQPRQEEEAKNTEHSESPRKHLLLC